ncbi:hypothetical protein CJU89_3961 [Yarrowia sp. B02]|nr:hypothetical protein CJU89_3961 [Yarrowia sp. B02]
MNEPTLRLVPTSRARVKRLISRDPSPLRLSQIRKDESTFAVEEMLSQRPPTDVRSILNKTVDALRRPEEGTNSRSRDATSLLFVEIQPAVLSKLQISTQFLLVKIDEADYWMERFGGDIWGVFQRLPKRQPVVQAEVVTESIMESADKSQEVETQEDTQEDQPKASKDLSPHKLLRPSNAPEQPARRSMSREDILSRAPVMSAQPARSSQDTFTSLIASLPPPAAVQTPYIPLNLTKPVAAVPLPSVSVSELLLSSYRSQLYCCKTSLIYFAKAMSKSRALCKSTLEKHTQGKSRVFSSSQMRKMSYKLYSRELAKLVQPLSEWSQVYEYAAFTKMMTNTKDEHVVQWKDSLSYSVMSDPEKLAVEISLLKFREMQLQSIVLLELLAVAPVAKTAVAAETTKAAELEKQKRKEARKMGLYKSRKPKAVEPETTDDSTDYRTLLSQLFSGMCIWQQLSDSGTDHVQEFCKSVVIPYFSSRVPDVVEDLLKRAGLEKEKKHTLARVVESRESTSRASRDSSMSHSRDSTPRANSPSLSRDTSVAGDSNGLHSDISTSSGISRAAKTTSMSKAGQTASGLLGKPQVRGGLLTSSRSFDSRSQIGMRFKGTKDKEKEKETTTTTATTTTTVSTSIGETGMFRKTREVSSQQQRQATQSTTQVGATPVKRTKPVLTSFRAEPDNPFVNDSEVVDDSPFGKRMRGESTGPRRRLGLQDGTSVVFDSAKRVRYSANRTDNDDDGVMDSPVQRSSRYSVVMESPTRTRTLGVASQSNHNNQGNNTGLFSSRPKTLFSSQTTIRPSMAAPVACVAATPKRRTQPTLTNEQFPRDDNPFYNGTDDAVMDTSPSKFVPDTPTRR